MVLKSPKPPLRSPRLSVAVAPSPNATESLISPIFGRLFIASLLIAVAGFYASQWNSIAPTIFSPNQVNPVEGPPLPAGLPLSTVGLFLPLGMVLMVTTQLRWLPVNNWTRAAIKLLLAGLALHYFIWRMGTLNLSRSPYPESSHHNLRSHGEMVNFAENYIRRSQSFSRDAIRISA
ncbi:MAG: hypothetical protein AAF329_17740, partial [Cyanobacteria bacterium P01_A01_bin.17]